MFMAVLFRYNDVISLHRLCVCG